jgi:pyrroline-5-carboxylate reductase
MTSRSDSPSLPARPPAALADRRILFIGGGNMANAMIGGLVESGVPAARIAVIEPAAASRQALQDKHGAIATHAAAADIGEGEPFDAVVLAVKPQQAATALTACRALLQRNPGAVVLSIAAGLGVELLVAMSGGHPRVVRAMPNTPSLIGEGIAGLYAPAGTDPDAKELAGAILSGTGQVVDIADEQLMDTVTAVSGSGPAYAFYLIEAMTEAGIAGGLEASSARALAVQTVKGAALLAEASEEPPEVLRARVTSPGGTTAAAVAVLDRKQVKASVGEAIQAAARRSRQLSDEARAARDPNA